MVWCRRTGPWGQEIKLRSASKRHIPWRSGDLLRGWFPQTPEGLKSTTTGLPTGKVTVTTDPSQVQLSIWEEVVCPVNPVTHMCEPWPCDQTEKNKIDEQSLLGFSLFSSESATGSYEMFVWSVLWVQWCTVIRLLCVFCVSFWRWLCFKWNPAMQHSQCFFNVFFCFFF